MTETKIVYMQTELRITLNDNEQMLGSGEFQLTGSHNIATHQGVAVMLLFSCLRN